EHPNGEPPPSSPAASEPTTGPLPRTPVTYSADQRSGLEAASDAMVNLQSAENEAGEGLLSSGTREDLANARGDVAQAITDYRRAIDAGGSGEDERAALDDAIARANSLTGHDDDSEPALVRKQRADGKWVPTSGS